MSPQWSDLNLTMLEFRINLHIHNQIWNIMRHRGPQTGLWMIIWKKMNFNLSNNSLVKSLVYFYPYPLFLYMTSVDKVRVTHIAIKLLQKKANSLNP